jgi:hypothetical protein
MMKQNTSRLTLILLFTVLWMCPGIFILGSNPGADIPQAIKNIEAFARLYGYVKYFHPADEAYEIDWDRFAVYGVKQVEPAKNSTELKKILEELFLPIAPSIVIYPANEKASFSVSRITPADTTGMKTIAWQHYGVRLNGTYRDFESLRLHRKVKYTGGFGNVMQMMKAEPFRGKEFIYKAAVKAESGNGHLWFRVDRPKRQMGFFDNMDDRPIRADEWKTYEIKGQIEPDALGIAFGCFLKSQGKIFIDDFQFLVKEGDQWKPMEIKNAGFENDKEGTKPETWNTTGEGYSFQVTAQTAAQGSKSFIIESVPVEGPGRLYPRNPRIGEYIDKDLGMGLSCIVPLALYGTDEQTYPPAKEEAFKNLLNTLKTEISPESTANDPYVRWADVVIAWNVFQHFYPYFDLVNADWQEELTRALQKAQTDKNEDDFLRTMREMTAKLQDGQNYITHPLEKNYSFFPFLVDWIENHVVITASNDKQLQKGDIILSVDGIAAADVLKKAETCISGSPQWKRARALAEFGLGPRNSTTPLKIKRNGRIMELAVTRNFTGEIDEFERKTIEELKGNIFYIDLAKLTWTEVEPAIEKLSAAKGVILDFRGSSRYGISALFPHLVDSGLQGFITEIPEVIYPDRQAIEYTGYDYTYPCSPPEIKAKKVFIIDNRTTGSPETFIGVARHYKLGEIIGRQTAGNNGTVNSFTLPGKYGVSWTGMRVLKHDRSQFHLKGIAPDVPVERTIKGVKEGKDELLEKAIEILRQ